MSEIAGATVDFTDYSNDPTIARTLHVPIAFTEASVQDLTDTLSAIQADLDNLIYENLLDVTGTAGKQNLGGGVLVGLTTTGNHVKVSFDARKGSAEEGTVTTGDANGVTLNDSAATFLTNGVGPGSQVTNLTDGSRCTVLRVVSEQQLITDGLGDGLDNQFAVSDAYEVTLVVQCEILGGNFVAIDQVGDPADAILPTAGTQIIRTSSASTTLLEQKTIQHASYNDRVEVDPTNISGIAASGTEYPSGTGAQPVDNFSDALAIMQVRGFSTARVRGVFTLPTLDFSADGLAPEAVRFEGRSVNVTKMTVPGGADVTDCEFRKLELDGTFDGTVLVDGCVLLDMSMVEGTIENSRLRGDIMLSGSGKFALLSCVDDSSGVGGTPTIDYGGAPATNDVIVRDYRGGLRFANKSSAADVSVDGTLRLEIAPDFGGSGKVILRGPGELEVEAGASATVDDRQLKGLDLQRIRKISTNELVVDIANQVLRVLDDDDATTLYEWPLRTDGGELVVTQEGVQTKRLAPTTAP